MSTFAKLFSRIAGGAASLSMGEAQKSLVKAGGFGPLSLTGAAIKRGVEKVFGKADSSGDGRVDSDEFVVIMRAGAARHVTQDWSTFVPDGRQALSQDEIKTLVQRAASEQGGALGAMVDASGIAKLAVKMLDDNGDGLVSKLEMDELSADRVAPAAPAPASAPNSASAAAPETTT